MTTDCTLAREQTARGLVLTLSRPDGGFHRVLVLPGGRGLVAADGAEGAAVHVMGPAEVEVAIGGDRFRLPAKLPR